GADALTGFSGYLLDLKVASSTMFSVNEAGNLLVMGSTTLQNVTFANATGTNATTTNFAVTGFATTSALRVSNNATIGGTLVVGTTTATAGVLTLWGAGGTAITNGTSDGADNLPLIIAGGGAASPTRGAFLALHGNESLATGNAVLAAGAQGSGGDIVFATDGSDRAIITDQGLVGIGTTTPYSKLSVWGSTADTGARIFEVTNSASTTMLSVSDSGTTTISFLDVGAMGFETDAGLISWTNMGSATSTGNLQMGYVAQLGDKDIFGLYGSTTGSGSIYGQKVIVGTTTAGMLGLKAGSTTPFLVSNGALCVGAGAANGSVGSCGDADLTAAGTVYANATAMIQTDLAETYPTLEDEATLGAGDILMFDTTRGVFVKKYNSSGGDQVLAGIVSTKPGVLLGGFGGKEYEDYRQVPVALSGRVPTKVSVEAGEIAIGDRITPSSISGVGMKATSTTQATVGIALEPFDGKVASTTSDIETYEKTGTIIVFVNLTSARLRGISGAQLDSGWLIDQETGTMKMAEAGTLDLQGKDIVQVRSIVSASGKWSITADGNLVVAGLTVGTAEQPTGITLFDRATGNPYCFYIEDGMSQTAAGICGTQTSDTSSQTSETTPSSTPYALAPTASDSEAPVITLNGNNPAVLQQGETFLDPGATVTDDKDENLGIKVGGDTVDTATPGTYSITYNATDADGNEAEEVTRTVVVEANDTFTKTETEEQISDVGEQILEETTPPTSSEQATTTEETS
ncbi:MAG: hypothetical protein COV10_01705, partial [Candidatus Vogelbacteria bacterium CG10_big_fil_rev_8_21_14_0_10_51_16]